MGRPRVSRSVAGALFLLMVVVSCKPAAGTARPTTATLSESPSPTASASAPVEPTPVSTPTSAPPPLPFGQPRSPSHRLLFTVTTASDETLYAYDVEGGKSTALITLPPQIRDHRWVTWAPDRSALLTLEPAEGGLPNYIHQFDVATGEFTSIKILDQYEWTIPLVPGRIPRIEAPSQSDRDLDDVSDVFRWGFEWAPDSSGFVFVLGATDLEEPEPTQIYYVKRGETEVIPIGAKAKAITVGEDPSWSPDGRYVLYLGDPLADVFGMWVIDLLDPDVPMQVIDFLPDGFPVWAGDSRSFYMQDESVTAEGETAHSLLEIVIPSGERRELLRVVTADEEQVWLVLGRASLDGKWLLVSEGHWIREDPANPASGYVYDPRNSPFHYLNLESGEDLELLKGENISWFSKSRANEWLFLQDDDRGVCTILRLPDLEPMIEPTAELCDTTGWSPDGHLLYGLVDFEVDSEGPVVIFDLDTRERIIVGDVPEGDITFLGWEQR